jgi:cysteine desulfurase/selenocysteine lyase
MINLDKIRADFPILSRTINGQPLIYLDNAATSQKPQSVIDAISNYYIQHNANVHRGVHTLSDESTTAYETARTTIANFIHSHTANQLIFTKNSTEAINMIAWSYGQKQIQEGDEIIITELEHHSNLLPWQRLATTNKAKVIICPVEGNGALAVDHLLNLINSKTKLIAITQIANVTGTIVDIKHLTKAIKKSGHQPTIVLDGAQSVPHMPVHIEELGVDFMVFSGHKMCGPQGIGVLWVNQGKLQTLEPFLVGGGMIDQVYADHATFAEFPDRFDAGTPNVAGAVGLAVACNYLDSIGMPAIFEHEQALTTYGLEKLQQLEDDGIITLYGTKEVNQRAGILTFTINGVHAHDAAQILDRECGIAIRSGHHCNQLLTRKLGVSATLRASFYLYNTQAEVDKLIAGIFRVKEIIHS